MCSTVDLFLLNLHNNNNNNNNNNNTNNIIIIIIIIIEEESIEDTDELLEIDFQK